MKETDVSLRLKELKLEQKQLRLKQSLLTKFKGADQTAVYTLLDMGFETFHFSNEIEFRKKIESTNHILIVTLTSLKILSNNSPFFNYIELVAKEKYGTKTIYKKDLKPKDNIFEELDYILKRKDQNLIFTMKLHLPFPNTFSRRTLINYLTTISDTKFQEITTQKEYI